MWPASITAGTRVAAGAPERVGQGSPPVKRRDLLRGAVAMGVLPVGCSPSTTGRATSRIPSGPPHRVRPNDPAWPSAASWDRLNRDVGGRLITVQSPLAECQAAPGSPACAEVVRRLKNPYYLGDQPGLTQTSGWVDGWTSAPSVYAVAARETADVVAAVNFARTNHLRLVVKGGGHSYQGTSSAPDSLLIWTRAMSRITLHEAFVGTGCAGTRAPQPAVTVDAGAIWMPVYEAVTTQAGRYVQGGGCTTVGVAGLIQSGGFGSFSKAYGLAAAGLLEAEVVTADGAVRTANACTHPDLFWGVKGGGGGSLGVVTRLTLRTRELPDQFGAVFGTIRATSDGAFRRLLARLIAFYRDRLFNPHWGEQLVFGRGNTVRIAMVCQGLDRPSAERIWHPFLDWVTRSPQDFTIEQPLTILDAPARRFWDAAFLRQNVPGLVVADDRPGSPAGNVFWATNQAEAGQFLHGYRSAWLPATLLEPGQQARLAEALFASTRHWGVSWHFNKGLAGAPPDAIAAARDTAMNPAVLDAFALAISASAGPPAYPGIPGPGPDLTAARRQGQEVGRAMDELLTVAPGAGSYVAESDFFESAWQQAFWGPNYPRLAAVKRTYDPAGLFVVHHGVGSEAWSADGLTRVAARQEPRR
jgi:FAD/FMN-containing dehydrogenase